MTSGRIERVGKGEVMVYDRLGELLEYFSGTALRSWCVVDAFGRSVEGWNAVLPGDAEDLLLRSVRIP